MRRLNLAPFKVKQQRADGVVEVPYMLRDSLVAVLFAEEQRLSAVNALKNDRIGNKILSCKDEVLLLEEEEYNALKAGMEATKGFGQQDVEMIRRVLDAPQVEVTEKPS